MLHACWSEPTCLTLSGTQPTCSTPAHTNACVFTSILFLDSVCVRGEGAQKCHPPFHSLLQHGQPARHTHLPLRCEKGGQRHTHLPLKREKGGGCHEVGGHHQRALYCQRGHGTPRECRGFVHLQRMRNSKAWGNTVGGAGADASNRPSALCVVAA